ncbi:hypothetical protein [Mangrovibacterium marinum]|uniref:hypothetical protein n=1 Tax=Mangrovibacterium marinum TaxID=1639118 RepID=UPI002A187EF7|nr:hypothetical protein [Mangrovibacterium marinum]
MSLVLTLATALFWSCQQDETMHNDAQAALKETLLPSPCDCVDEPLFMSGPTTVNNKENYAQVDYWNDNENFYIQVTANDQNTIESIALSYPFDYELDGAPKNCNYKINYNIDYSEAEPFHSHLFIFPLTGDWQCSIQQFALRVNGIDGNPVYYQEADASEDYSYEQGNKTITGVCDNVPMPISYLLSEICEQGCDESFSYTDNQNGTLTFYYTPAEAMSEVSVVFTFPQVEYITFLSGYEYESFARPGKGNAQNMQATLSFDACTEYSWTVQLVDCTAANATANGWTDFKVDDSSKKNEQTPNYQYSCPQQ